MKRARVAGLLALFGLIAGCGNSSSEPELPFGSGSPAASVPAGPSGQIRGFVRLEGAPPEPAFDPITENQHVCGDQASLPRLQLGEENGIKDAFVFLESVDGALDTRPRQGSILIDQEDCQYVPHAMAVPVGTEIEIVNSDPILHNVHAHVETEQGNRTLFNIAQAVAGARTQVDLDLDEPGFIYLTCEAGHPWMSAHILVTEHPYVAITDENGEFVIDNVPVGTYRLTMWHEGVTLVQNIRSLQRYVYEAPYEDTREVEVLDGSESMVDFSFALRPTG